MASKKVGCCQGEFCMRLTVELSGARADCMSLALYPSRVRSSELLGGEGGVHSADTPYLVFALNVSRRIVLAQPSNL